MQKQHIKDQTNTNLCCKAHISLVLHPSIDNKLNP